ncbi:MAG: dipeptide ABC transporter ATP-binding protein [Alphaproteobacteria bacterium]|nr:dipeptide ABC transporter ATP-binding protein [Alphaproteobacteria bacterium]
MVSATLATPDTAANRPGAAPVGNATVLDVVSLKKHFPVKKGLLRRTVGQVYAVDGVSFSINEGETLGLVGESGCGKSTVARTVLRLIEPTSGAILLDGTDVTRLGKRAMRPYRRQMQMIFQDPFSSLNPRMSAGDIVREPLLVHELDAIEEDITAELAAKGRLGAAPQVLRDEAVKIEEQAKSLIPGFRRRRKAEHMKRVGELFDQVGLRRSQMHAFPHEFSGGQRQRISIARALALNPKLIVADEPVSALDVSIQAQVINLMMDLQRERRLSYLFIAHDLAVVEHISHRIAVMYLGKIVEYADKKTLFTQPKHPYTEALLSAVPVPNPKLRREKKLLQGDVPSPINPPPGCTFHTRCPYAEARCREEVPMLKEIAPGHGVSCHLVN